MGVSFLSISKENLTIWILLIFFLLYPTKKSNSDNQVELKSVGVALKAVEHPLSKHLCWV